MANVKDYPPYLDYPKPRKIQTNADRIRAMSDEELLDCLYYEFLDEDGSRDCIWNWLQQPVEDE